MSHFIASSYEIDYCDDPRCHCVHLHLKDREGIVRAAAAFPVEDIAILLDLIRDTAYAVATHKDVPVK